MNNYDIEIEEVLRRVVPQKADTFDEALAIVHDKYDREEIVLDSSDFVEVSFNNLYSKKLDNSFNISLDYNLSDGILVISSGDKKENYVCDCIRDINRCVETFTADYLENTEIEADKMDELEQEI